VDPIAGAIRAFQEAFREFRRDRRARVLRITTTSKDIPALSKLLRAEEWRADNSSPFLILETAIGAIDEALPAFGAAIREHYELVRRGLADDGVTVEPFSAQFPLPADLIGGVVNDVAEFRRKVAPPLAPPLVFFVPVKVDRPAEWHDVFLRLLGPLIDLDVRVIVADMSNDPALQDALRPLGPLYDETSFVVDEAAADAAAKGALAAATSRNGATHWVVGPAAEPPPRPSRPQPTEEQVKAAVAAAGLPPVLTQSQGELLRGHVMRAADAVGAGNARIALEEQSQAVALCRGAGVMLETVLMTMLLASYQYQFGLRDDAEATYRAASALATESNAWAQAAQAQMALGYILLGSGRGVDAAATYTEAVAAAERADASLLFLESARMAGKCWIDSGEPEQAARVWRTAVEKGKEMTALEIRSSTLLQIADSLTALLRNQGATADAEAVEQTIGVINRKFEA
jgi:tetratricopeptide (TPR) repeat protein